MMKLFIICGISALLVISTQAQNVYLKDENRKYLFSKKDSVESTYIKRGGEGSVRIDLYNDSLYGYHAFAVIERTARFSAGTWKIVNDSLLVLKSDKRLFEKVFNRNKRQVPIERYSFLDFDPLMMVIYPEKCIYPIRKVLQQ